MHFLLTTLKVVYVLTTPMTELMEDSTVEAIRIRAKWENDDYICRGHILNGMSDFLFDVYTNVESAKELWDSLESKYMTEDSSNKKFLDFKHTLKHGKDDLSLVQLGSHLRIEESLRAQNSDKGNGKEVAGPSCSKTSHFKRDCRSGNKKNVNAGGSGKGLRTIPKTKVDAIAWWINSGATTHVCKDRCWFKTYEPVEDGSVLYMGDDHSAPVHEKGRIIHETTASYTPQQNGVAERKNRALKEMVNFMSSYLGLSERFWEEAMLTACYLLNRVPSKRNKTTPYELWFYVIEPNDLGSVNSIIESRDAIFDENRFSSIPRPKDIIPNSDESQRDDHSDDVPSEISKPRKVLRRILEPIINLCNLVMLLSGKKQLMMRQKEGIDYFDTYAPVARITTIRLLLALVDIHNLVIHQMDVKTIFLNGDLDEKVYMKQPKGFVMPSNEHKIKRETKEIVITQSHYIEKILKKFNREDCSPVSTPMDPVENLKPNTGKPVDQLEYSRDIGFFMYAMTSTRPDIAYAVGTMNNGLSYVRYPSVLEAYLDASWIDHVEDSSSTSGWVFLLGGGVIS
uniref:Integrase catalytic domain-containing protein n=1 Tax=Tanacetum cinerariifolium TaxID=118510 RepID=A0A699I9L4_TANCI|nr:hypothetical protein [Tanacetum cinerariifolium]